MMVGDEWEPWGAAPSLSRVLEDSRGLPGSSGWGGLLYLLGRPESLGPCEGLRVSTGQGWEGSG